MRTEPTPDMLDAAAAWHARLHGGDASDADWVAFVAWLEGDPARRHAFDRIEAVWIDSETLAVLGVPDVVPLGRQRRPSARPAYWWAAGLTAAAAAMAVWIFVGMPAGGTEQAFRTDGATTQSIALDDGTKLTLNRATDLTVKLGSDRREATLGEGEVSFDVAHDTSRPFAVSAGPRTVRVTGTEFNVLRHEDHLTVTVRRGTVEVDEDSGQVLAKLGQGAQFSIADDQASAVPTAVNPDDFFAWRDGRLIYDNAPLQRVADDLSRYFGRPVLVAPAAATLTVSGVLQIDKEAVMLARLARFVPILARVSANEIVLDPR